MYQTEQLIISDYRDVYHSWLTPVSHVFYEENLVYYSDRFELITDLTELGEPVRNGANCWHKEFFFHNEKLLSLLAETVNARVILFPGTVWSHHQQEGLEYLFYDPNQNSKRVWFYNFATFKEIKEKELPDDSVAVLRLRNYMKSEPLILPPEI